MLQFDTRTMLDGTPPRRQSRAGATPRALSPAAQKIAEQPLPAAYSPIVLAGTVRLIEFALVMLVGFAVYAAYVVPLDGFAWHYLARHRRHRRCSRRWRSRPPTSIRCRPSAATRSSISGSPPPGRSSSSSSSASRSSPRPATSSRASGSASFYVVGLIVLIAFRRALFLLVRRWTRRAASTAAPSSSAPTRKAPR